MLEIVRDNYDSLTLKLQEGLDAYELYSADTPTESAFLKDILESVVLDYRERAETEERDYMAEHSALIAEIMKCNETV